MADKESLDQLRTALLELRPEEKAVFLLRQNGAELTAAAAVALGAGSPEAPEIRAAAERISTAARRAEKPVMVFVGSNKDALAMREIGACAFIYSSDQGLMRQAAGRVRSSLRYSVG